MSDGCDVVTYSTCHIAPTNGVIVTKLGCSPPITSPLCLPLFGCRSMAFSQQQRIEHSAVISVWWSNAWSNFYKMLYTAAC